MLTEPTQAYPLPGTLREKIDQVLETHDYDYTQIVGILLEVQDLNERHYIPEPVAYYIAYRLDMRVTNVYDIINFYSELSDKPRAKYPIQVCSSIACRVNDSANLAATLKDILSIDFGETTYDGRFTLEKVTCFGACDRAPAVRINGHVYDHLDSRAKIEHLLASLD